MKRLRLCIGLGAFSGLLGCAMATSPVNGFLYKDVKFDGGATEAYGGSARGEACASSILGWVATGDASLEAAKKAGNIAQVVAIDHTSSSILTFYAKYCTIVYGKRAAVREAPPAPKTDPTPAPPAEKPAS